ncbi:MAG TPA: transglycosylase SLT domain-containing protein [Patescibacteria group bacterium]|nr:transglycosylase SLT domain-containing protein [Patescibacteria group bacterium]
MNQPDREKLYSRRDILGVATATAIGTVAAGTIGTAWFIDSQRTASRLAATAAGEGKVDPIVGIPPFEDKDANELARQKGITVDKFFIFSSPALSDKLSAFLGDTLFPIYPLTVLDINNRKLIYALAKEFSTPPNVIATIMTIESCGIENEESPSIGAQGLFQVMPFHFDQSIQNNPKAMQNPLLNGRTGMKYFTQVCLPAARAGYPSGYPKDHVNIYARAMMAYNAGSSGATVNFNNLPDETKFYGDHFIRFAMTAELADGLRKKENGDLDIVKKLSSTEMDARAWALQEFNRRSKEKAGYSYDEYIAALKEIVLETPGVDKKTQTFTQTGEGFNRDYKDFLSDHKYALKVSPGLRIWLALGGTGLFLKDKRNTDLKEWDKIQSRP